MSILNKRLDPEELYCSCGHLQRYHSNKRGICTYPIGPADSYLMCNSVHDKACMGFECSPEQHPIFLQQVIDLEAKLYKELMEVLHKTKIVGRPMLKVLADDNLPTISEPLPTVVLTREQYIDFHNSFNALVAFAVVVLKEPAPSMESIVRWTYEKLKEKKDHGTAGGNK